LPGMTCLAGDGTFYAFPNVQDVIDRLPSVNNDVELAEKLINEANVALVPGSAFGAPGHVRLSFATSMETLQEAVARLKRFLNGG
ncbi:MAG: aminotransferase class I/II-fold pyridoxal phosphate-dependent enzyme, partial [Thiohalobacteraceae bacterium]